MEQYIYDDSNGLWYRLCGDCYIPCLTLEDTADCQIGRYGRLHRKYLREHRPGVYAGLMAEGALFQHLADIDRSCREQMDTIIAAMKKCEDVTEALKAADHLEWVRRMNGIHNRAEEIVLNELVYEI